GVMDGLVVYPERMQRNLERTQGLIFSSKVLNALIEAGLAREAAYAIVKTHSMRAWREEVPLRSLLDADAEVTSRLTAAQLDASCARRWFRGDVDAACRRLGLGVGVE